MISAWTPPGTKVVALYDFQPKHPLVLEDLSDFNLTKDDVYTVEGMVETFEGDVAVRLVEKPHSRVLRSSHFAAGVNFNYSRNIFRRLELPECLASIPDLVKAELNREIIDKLREHVNG